MVFGRCNPWVPSGSALTLRKVVKVPEAPYESKRKMGIAKRMAIQTHCFWLVGCFGKKNEGEIIARVC